MSLKREIFIRDVPFSKHVPTRAKGKWKEFQRLFYGNINARHAIFTFPAGFNAHVSLAGEPRVQGFVPLAGSARAFRSNSSRGGQWEMLLFCPWNKCARLREPRHGRALFSDFAPIVRLRTQLPLSKERVELRCIVRFPSESSRMA